jgi:hypothetical protein
MAAGPRNGAENEGVDVRPWSVQRRPAQLIITRLSSLSAAVNQFGIISQLTKGVGAGCGVTPHLFTSPNKAMLPSRWKLRN